MVEGGSFEISIKRMRVNPGEQVQRPQRPAHIANRWES